MHIALAAAVAFVNITVIPLDRERLEMSQTVLVQGDRIVAVGATGAVAVPGDATIVDGRGRYLVPGLTDAHVHLNDLPWAHARRDFGDAPLYLAYGITTVVNLSGTPEILDWRRRVAAGALVGPTIYTSGRFVNEPRVNTPDEVERDIAGQAREGYDLIKFHELDDTTTGLSRAAYLKMIETARKEGLPLVGHAPVNLGLDVMLQAHQPLAHLGMLTNIRFLPLAGHLGHLLVVAASLFALLVFAVAFAGVRALAGWTWLAGVLAVVCAVAFLPGGPLFESIALRALFTLLASLVAVAAGVALLRTVRFWRDAKTAMFARVKMTLLSIVSVALASTLWIFWVPVSWRSTDGGIERLARRIHDAGIPVQSTLVVYESFSGAARSSFIHDPAIDHLRAETRDQWRRMAPTGRPGYGLHRLQAMLTTLAREPRSEK